MWVAPAARGSGAAAALVDQVLEWARARGARGVSLRVVTYNEQARRFYQRIGFVDNGVRDTLPDGRPEIEMEYTFSC